MAKIEPAEYMRAVTNMRKDAIRKEEEKAAEKETEHVATMIKEAAGRGESSVIVENMRAATRRLLIDAGYTIQDFGSGRYIAQAVEDMTGVLVTKGYGANFDIGRAGLWVTSVALAVVIGLISGALLERQYQKGAAVYTPAQVHDMAGNVVAGGVQEEDCIILSVDQMPEHHGRFTKYACMSGN